jgi:signal transduction histidine kinase
VIRVCDSGIGIEPGALPGLFSPFAQVHRARDRNPAGLGLGLALVKGLVDVHGGRVTAESDGPGQGTQITIRLPLTSPSTPPGWRGERTAEALDGPLRSASLCRQP